jgi:hypothetical protein
VLACVVPLRPTTGQAGSSAAPGLSPSAGKQQPSPSVCIPFKTATSFTVQLLPPPGADQQVAYVVIEHGPHTLEGGARLIAGEEMGVMAGGSRAVRFDQIVATDESGGAFDRHPTLVCTVQSGEALAGLRAASVHCESADPTGFSMCVRTSDANRNGAARVGSGGGTSHGGPSSSGDGADGSVPEPVLADEEQHAAAVRLQARVRGRAARLAVTNLRMSGGLHVGWLACDAEGGDGILSGTSPLDALGAPFEIAFGIDYPEPPVLLYGLTGGSSRQPQCTHLDERCASVRCGGGAADSGGGAATGATVGWVALPSGLLRPLEESEVGDESDAEGLGEDEGFFDGAAAEGIAMAAVDAGGAAAPHSSE